MSSCCQYSNLKSSVYNQTGQGYFAQLAAYNNMTVHLKRVLSAKSRVDSRNPNYIQYLRNKSTGRSSRQSIDRYSSENFIDKLAYDTQHHPLDFVRMEYLERNSRSRDRRKKKGENRCACWSKEYIEKNSGKTIQFEIERNRSVSRNHSYNSRLSFHSIGPKRRDKKNNNEKDKKKTNSIPSVLNDIQSKSANSSHPSSPRSSKSKFENDPGGSNYESSFESSDETSENHSKELESNPSLAGSVYSADSGEEDDEDYDEDNEDKDADYLLSHKRSETAQYSQFILDITEEIVEKGLYTNEELHKVFKKHLKKNLGMLDKNKMLYELYQLKLSLNLINHENGDGEYDEDEENVDGKDEEELQNIEESIHPQQFTTTSAIKPLTPPKLADGENKVIDKLMNQNKLRETCNKSFRSSRNTTADDDNAEDDDDDDGNSELYVTHRDILSTLMAMNINPNQANDIYKYLRKKSARKLLVKENSKSSKDKQMYSKRKGKSDDKEREFSYECHDNFITSKQDVFMKSQDNIKTFKYTSRNKFDCTGCSEEKNKIYKNKSSLQIQVPLDLKTSSELNLINSKQRKEKQIQLNKNIDKSKIIIPSNKNKNKNKTIVKSQKKIIDLNSSTKCKLERGKNSPKSTKNSKFNLKFQDKSLKNNQNSFKDSSASSKVSSFKNSLKEEEEKVKEKTEAENNKEVSYKLSSDVERNNVDTESAKSCDIKKVIELHEIIEDDDDDDIEESIAESISNDDESIVTEEHSQTNYTD